MQKRKIATFILILFFVVILVYSYKFIKHREEYAVTDAVFVKTDRISNIGFKRVKGKIIKLYKEEGDFVKKGEILAELDSSTYETNYREIEKQIDSLNAEKQSLILKINRIQKEINNNIKIAENNIKIIDYQISSNNFKLKQIEVELLQLKRDYERFKNLYKVKAIAKRKFEEVETKYQAVSAEEKSLKENIKALKFKRDVAKNQYNIAIAKKNTIFELKQKLISLTEKINGLIIKKKDIKKMIEECKLKSVVSGVIGKKFQEVGNIVKAGNPIYSIVDLNKLYILVLLEETKIEGVKKGCFAKIKIDAYPDKEFEGEVENILPASAATYALVPRDISAGEFTKVAQRIFVRIKITKGDKSLLRVGMGGEVEIKREK